MLLARCLMVLAVLHILGEHDFLYAVGHSPLRIHVHHVADGLVPEVALHIGHIDHLALRELLKLRDVYVGDMAARKSPASKPTGANTTLSCVAVEVNLTLQATPSRAWMVLCTLMPPFFFPLLGLSRLP